MTQKVYLSGGIGNLFEYVSIFKLAENCSDEAGIENRKGVQTSGVSAIPVSGSVGIGSTFLEKK